jgi:antitoxin component YwqK of YwqJK toxin-antitoxin module
MQATSIKVLRLTNTPISLSLILSNLKIYIYIIVSKIAKVAFCLLPLLSLSQKAADSVEYKVYYYEGGAKSSEGNLVNGQPNGFWKSYWRNGNLKTAGNRKNFTLDSIWVFYNEDGVKTSEITYQQGDKEGLTKSFSEGILIKTEPFEKNKINGLVSYYYPNGSLKKEIPYEKGKAIGTGFIYALSDKRITAILTYKNGQLVRQQEINQIDQQNQKQGLWIDFYPNRNAKVEGPYLNDLKNGYWKYYQANGNLIRVEKWIMGVLQEGAKEAAKVEIRRTLNPNTGKLASKGAYRDGEPVGVHRQYNNEGEVISSKIYEEGVVLYEGVIDDRGRKQGPWKHFYPNGTLKAKGSYKDDLKIAEWKYFYPEAEKVEQIGSYFRGEPDGEWLWYFEDGSNWRVENFYQGKEEGKSIEYNDTGAVIAEGNYVDGFKEGFWFLQINDHREEGTYFEGQRTGKWQSFYLNSDQLRFEGQYENGIKNGEFVFYYDNGQVKRRGYYLNNTRNALWEFFTENGERIITIEYQEGEEIRYNGEKISYGRRYEREKKLEKARAENKEDQ